MFKVLLIQLTILVIILAGCGQDVYKLCHCDFKAPVKAEIVYGIGLIPPLGAIIGWLNIDDTPAAE